MKFYSIILPPMFVGSFEWVALATTIIGVIGICFLILSYRTLRVSIKTKMLITDFFIYISGGLICTYILTAIAAYCYYLPTANQLGGLSEIDKEELYFAPFRIYLALDGGLHLFSIIFFLFTKRVFSRYSASIKQ
jgi:hypothetical protein